MDRRTFLAGAGAMLLAAPPVAETQEARVRRIGVLSLDFPNDSVCVDALRRSLNDLGYAEGRTHVLELRWAKDHTDLLPSLAADLVRMKVDLIVSASGLQLLKEVVPKASRFALLRLPGPLQDLVVRDMEVAARRLGVQLQVIEVRRVEDLPAAFDAAVAGRAQGVMSTQSPFFVHNNVPIAQLALKHRLPSLSGEPGAAKDGALLFYGPNVFEGCSRAGKYIDRILKGAKPADLPVEQPTKIDFVINLKTAKALGLTISPSLLGRADEVIQ